MRKLVFAGLGAMVFASLTSHLTTSVSATEVVAVRQSSRITPYSLVSSGYQGQLKPQGIPAAEIFLRDARVGNLTAIELIEAGIATGRLDRGVLDDRSYVQAVEGVLKRTVRR